MRVLVCGSRSAKDPVATWNALQDLHRVSPITFLIAGAATGVDTHALEWARLAGVPNAAFQASWTKLGGAAGPRRNGWMLEFGKPDMVLAMPGGVGTENMIRQAVTADVGVKRAT